MIIQNKLFGSKGNELGWIIHNSNTSRTPEENNIRGNTCEWCNAFFQALFLRIHPDCLARKEQNVSSRFHFIVFTEKTHMIKNNGFVFQAAPQTTTLIS